MPDRSQYLKAGRWTYAEERQLIDSIRSGKSVAQVAMDLRRSETSTRKKANELSLALPESDLTPAQLDARGEADHFTELAHRCLSLAAEAGHIEIENHLKRLATEYQEQAWAIEARAKISLTRNPP